LESEQLGHGNRFGLWLALATPDHIRDRQSLGGIIAAKKHANKFGHFTGVVFADCPPAKRANCARIFFAKPAFHGSFSWMAIC
jgi:hypothetical protein